MSLRAFVPEFVKVGYRWGMKRYRGRMLGAVLEQIGENPTRTGMQRLVSSWGNEGWSADADYLLAIARYAKEAEGPILECGSGLSTLVAAACSPHPVFSLEHAPEWLNRVRDAARRHSLSPTLIEAPIVDRGDYSWYEVPPGLPPWFSFVVCDGPPNFTKGGRYGLLPELSDRLAGSVLLIDDVHVDEYRQTVEKWSQEWRLGVKFFGTFAVAHMPV